jgi:hypothetical protein
MNASSTVSSHFVTRLKDVASRDHRLCYLNIHATLSRHFHVLSTSNVVHRLGRGGGVGKGIEHVKGLAGGSSQLFVSLKAGAMRSVQQSFNLVGLLHR